MVIPRHRVKQAAMRLLLAASATVVLCQCETQRTYGEVRRGSIKFDEAMWGGQGGGDDAQEIRSKFAEKGYKIGEDGSIVADKPNLFSNEEAKGIDNQFGKKEAKFKNKEARTNEFRTPEYIKRQEFAGVEDAQESGSRAREAGQGNREGRKLFQRTNRQTSSELASFETVNARGSQEQFSTNPDAAGSQAISNAPKPMGVRQAAGYRSNAGMSVDDVKKMLSPGVYANTRGL